MKGEWRPQARLPTVTENHWLAGGYSDIVATVLYITTDITLPLLSCKDETSSFTENST